MDQSLYPIGESSTPLIQDPTDCDRVRVFIDTTIDRLTSAIYSNSINPDDLEGTKATLDTLLAMRLRLCGRIDNKTLEWKYDNITKKVTHERNKKAKRKESNGRDGSSRPNDTDSDDFDRGSGGEPQV